MGIASIRIMIELRECRIKHCIDQESRNPASLEAVSLIINTQTPLLSSASKAEKGDSGARWPAVTPSAKEKEVASSPESLHKVPLKTLFLAPPLPATTVAVVPEGEVRVMVISPE